MNNLENNLSLNDFLILVKVNIKLILILVFACIAIAAYITYTTPPVYKATTAVMIKEKPGSSMVMNIGGYEQKSRMSNEVQLLRSRRVAKEVIKRLWQSDLRNSLYIFETRMFFPKGERVRRAVRELFSLGFYDPSNESAKSYYEPYSNEIAERFADKVIKSLKVVPRQGTDVIDITFKSVYGKEAMSIANIIAEVYKDLEKEISAEEANSTVEFLDEMVKKQELKLAEAEEAIKNYKIDHNMYDSEGSASLFSNRLATLESEIYNNFAETNIRNEQIAFLESKLTDDEKNLADKISTDINAQMVALRSDITSLESQLIQNSMIYGETHGAVIEINKKLIALKIELDKKVKVLIGEGITFGDPLVERQNNISQLLSLRSEIFGLNLKRGETLKLKEIYSNKISELPEKQLNFARLKRDESVLTQNYSYIRQQLEAAKIRAASGSGKVQIIDVAKKPDFPVSPNNFNDIFTGFIFSVFLSIIVVYFKEFLDNSIRNPIDIEKHNLSILGIIPSIGGKASVEKKSYFFRNGRKTNRSIKRSLITREDPRSPISEAYRSLRTSLLYTDIDMDTKSILVSSAGPGEGKTTTVANMAITYANLGKKTLLIDTDLRRPVVHKVLELKKEPGITNYLAGATKNFSDLIQKTDIQNLFVVTSGIIPPNPSELLGSDKMALLINKLEKEWDIVLFDSPPLVAVTDATMISKEIDKIVIVVKVGQTDKGAFSRTVELLNNVKAPIGGVVLNAVTQNSSYGSYYYYYQYYNYYGSEKT